MPICHWFWAVSRSGARPGSVLQPAGPVGQIAFQWCLCATVVALAIVAQLEGAPRHPISGRQRQHARGHWSAQWVLTPRLGTFCEGVRPRTFKPDEMEPDIARGGWQHEAASKVERNSDRKFSSNAWDLETRPILRSQGSSGAGLALTMSPPTLMTKIPPRFRTILLRLRLPLPFSRCMCPCGRPIDSFWPPPCIMRQNRGIGAGSNHQRCCLGSGFARPRSRRQSQIGSCRGWVAHFRWVPVGLGTRRWCVPLVLAIEVGGRLSPELQSFVTQLEKSEGSRSNLSFCRKGSNKRGGCGGRLSSHVQLWTSGAHVADGHTSPGMGGRGGRPCTCGWRLE